MIFFPVPCDPSGFPQARQYLSPDLFSVPQLLHLIAAKVVLGTAILALQLGQKAAVLKVSSPHSLHLTSSPLASAIFPVVSSAILSLLR